MVWLAACGSLLKGELRDNDTSPEISFTERFILLQNPQYAGAGDLFRDIDHHRFSASLFRRQAERAVLY